MQTSKHVQINAQNFSDIIQELVDEGGFNDLYIITGYKPYIRINGKLKALFNVALSSFCVQDIARLITGNDQVAGIIAAGGTIDMAYAHYSQRVRTLQHRFRVNIKGVRALGGGSGMGITLREIKTQAPSVETLGVEQDIIESFFPRNGIVLVSGPTGSGKTTLYASLLQHLAQKVGRDLVIGTAEAPIEYVFDHIEMESVLVYQSEIADPVGHIGSFTEAVRASLRSGTDGMVVGEMRDLETIRAALTAANTGQVVWGTLHVNSVEDIPSRIINVFPHAEMNKVKVEFFSSVKFLICQILVNCIKPGQARVAVKEWLKITKPMSRQLIAASIEDVPALIRKFLHESGMPMSTYAKKLLDDGLIDDETYQYVVEGEQ